MRFETLQRFSKSQPKHRMHAVACGYCHEPAIPNGALLVLDTSLPPEPETFVQVAGPDLRYAFAGDAIKFLHRNSAGELELVSNVGRAPFTERITIVATVVAIGHPEPDTGGLDARMRDLEGAARERELARRDQVTADALSRWGQPAPTDDARSIAPVAQRASREPLRSARRDRFALTVHAFASSLEASMRSRAELGKPFRRIRRSLSHARIVWQLAGNAEFLELARRALDFNHAATGPPENPA